MITSLSNERIKFIRRLKDRKTRSESGLFFVEGIRITYEALNQKAGIQQLIFSPELLSSDVGWKLVEETRDKIEQLEVSSEVFRSISQKEGPQGLAAVIRQQNTNLESVQNWKGLWVALDSIADPGNLGTIIRTTESAGGEGVILLDQTTDPFDPTAIRASMGAIFDIKIVRCSLSEFAAWKNENGFMVVGTDGEADIDFRKILYPQQVVVLMGSEREGLLPTHYEICDSVVKIPMAGKSDSLNLAVATGIMVYEIFSQWHPIVGGENDIHHPG